MVFNGQPIVLAGYSTATDRQLHDAFRGRFGERVLGTVYRSQSEPPLALIYREFINGNRP